MNSRLLGWLDLCVIDIFTSSSSGFHDMGMARTLSGTW